MYSGIHVAFDHVIIISVFEVFSSNPQIFEQNSEHVELILITSKPAHRAGQPHQKKPCKGAMCCIVTM